MSLLLAACSALFACALALAGLVRAAPRLGLVDVPTARSTHAHPVPRVGGPALLAGLLAGGAVLALAHDGALDDAAAWMPYVLPGACFFLLGLADDRWRLGPGRKFLLQAAIAALGVGLGLRWEGAPLGPFGALSLGAAAPALTGVWIVAVVTLVNFVDGIDLITALGALVLLGAAAGGRAGPGGGALDVLAAAAVLGFVPWNLAPARAFPGDAATHLLGFLMACAALSAPAHGVHALPWAAASAPLLPGVLDVGLGLAAKARRGIPLARAHNQHLYQRLTRVGRSHVAVAVRYALLDLAALLAVAWVAPRTGLGACLGLSALLLLAHLGQGHWRTRQVPHRFAPEEPLPAPVAPQKG
jgi:UDP-N-acetylmuramyl pentapeptide phosphotransferase/UDP-N-acetylglucosamine-1-phosphate transferase